jgi:DNA-binding PadR family transcriptional regulator
MFYDIFNHDYPHQHGRHGRCGHKRGDADGGFGHGRGGGERGPGGFGGFGRGFMGGGIPGGRRLGSGDLQLVLLSLLAEQPAHGYELIRTLEERSGGFYTPSPGMVYPALTYLEEIGHAAVTPEGNRKLYSITDAGREHVAGKREQTQAILETLQRIGARMAEVRDAYAGIHEGDNDMSDALHSARHEFKSALSAMRGCSAGDAQQLLEILRRATAEIRDLRK